MPGGGGGLTDGGGEATRVRRQPGRGRISGGRWRRRDLGGVGLSVLGGGVVCGRQRLRLRAVRG
jgi:hypothetical protein